MLRKILLIMMGFLIITSPLFAVTHGILGDVHPTYRVSSWYIDTNWALVPGYDNVFDIGTSALRVNDINMGGVLTQTGNSATGLVMGTSGTPLTLITVVPEVSIYTTSAATTGTIRSVLINQTQTGAGSTILEAFRVNIDSEVRTGSWANAIVGRMDYGTTGDAAGGMAASICAEMNMPAKDHHVIGGDYHMLDLELNCPTNFSHNTSGSYGISFINIGLWGNATAIGTYEDYGWLLRTDGFTAGAGNVLSATSQTFRVDIEGTNRYLMFSQYEDTLSIGLTGAKKTAVTGVPEIAVWRTSALTSGSQDLMKLDWTQTANTTGYQKGIRSTITSNYSLGSSAKAIYGAVSLADTGSSTGYVAALAGDVTIPNMSLAHGGAYALDLQVIGQASSSMASAGPVAFIHFALAGTKTTLETQSYLFVVDGLTDTAGNIFDTDATPTCDATLRILVNTTPYYILLSNSPTS